MAAPVALKEIRCEGTVKGRPCGARLGDVEAGARYSFKCGRCNTPRSGVA